MTQHWHDFLLSLSFENIESIFKDGAADVLCPLNNRRIVRAQGTDAEKFLQSQFSNDIALVTEKLSQLNGYCTPKGRLLALFRVLRQQEDFLLIGSRGVTETALERLRKYILMAKVQLQSEEQVQIGLSGPNSDSLLQDAMDSTGALPRQIHETTSVEGCLVTRVGDDPPRFEITATPEHMMELCTSLSRKTAVADDRVWQWLEIRAGLPWIFPETQELFIPQSINLDLINGVSFTKGCYPGQEIVARMNYLGTLKKRMYLCACGQSAEPGTPIISGHDREGNVAGHVVSIAASPQRGFDLLAELQVKFADLDGLALQVPGNPPLSRLPLPYSIPAVEKKGKKIS